MHSLSYFFSTGRSRRFAGSRLLLLLGLLMLAAAPTQAQRWAWSRFTNGAGDEFGQRTAVDASGNVYVAGFFSGTTSFNPSANGISLTSAGSYDVFVVKYDPSGTALWAVRAGGTGDDRAQDLTLDAAGNVYLLSNYLSASASFGQVTLTNPAPGAFNDVCVAKLTTNGAWVWAVRGGGTGDDSGSALALDASGNVFITGQFQGTASFGVSLTSAGNYDVFIAKLSTNGGWQWGLRTGGTSSDGGRGLAIDPNGFVCLTGYFAGTLTAGALSVASNGASNDVFVARLASSNGSWQWLVRGGGTGIELATDLAVDAANNIYVSGTFSGASGVFGVTSLVNNGGQDIFVGKLANTGAWQWAARAGGTTNDGATSLAVDAMGDVTIAGYQGSPSATFGSTTLAVTGVATDPILASLTSATGAWQWAGKCLYGSGYDNAVGVCTDPAGVLYATGNFNSSPFVLGNGNGFLAELPGNSAPGGGYNMFCGKLWAPPTVTAIAPASGPVGTTLTLTGANLSPSNFVTINGVMTTNIVVNSPTSITAVVPVGANLNARPQPIRVNNLNGGGYPSAGNFTVTGTVTVLADSVAALPGTVITVPVRVRGFQSMAALQGSLTFDATKLTFAGVTQLGLAGLVAANVAAPASGKLTFAWNNPTNAATTVADDAVIFAVKFSVGALAPGQGLPLDFANAPVAVLVMKSDFTTPTIITRSGKAQAPAGSATLSGGIATGSGALVPGVTISCTPLAAAQAAVTNANGQFTFPGLVAGGTYGLYPSKTNDVTVNNGLSVLDLALMQRHILGVTLLGNAYNVVAADADRSGTVTVADVALTRGVLLGAATAFPRGRHWVFVRGDQTFANPNQPWPVDTFRVFNSFTTLMGQGFVACHLGDVDNSWNAAIPRPAPGVVPVALAVADATGGAGQRFTVPVCIGNGFQRLSALQLTAAWDPAALRLVTLTAADLPGLTGNAAQAAATGRLPLVWTDAAGASLSRPPGAVAAYLTFEVLQAAGSTTIELTNDILPGLAYDASLGRHPLTVRAGTVTITPAPLGGAADVAAASTLLVYPNPAHHTVHVSQAPGDGVELFDNLGRLVRSQLLTAGAAALDLRGLPAGLYTVRAENSTRRLVVE